MGIMNTVTTPARRAPADVSPATAAALSITCPACDAAVDRWCLTTTGGRASRMHEARYRAAPPLEALVSEAADTAWIAEQGRLQAQIRDLTAALVDARETLGTALKHEAAWEDKLRKIQPELKIAKASAKELEAQLDTARKACDAALAEREAHLRQISDLQDQVRELGKRKPPAVKVPVPPDDGWVRDGARRYVEGKFQTPVADLTEQGIPNITEKWLWAAARGDRVTADRLTARIEAYWAQVHANCH